MKKFIIICIGVLIIFGCNDSEKDVIIEDLPYLGFHEFSKRQNEYGETVFDTLYHTIPNFNFINQDSMEVGRSKYMGHIFIADFFFTSCPTICPKKTEFLSDIQDSLKSMNILDDVQIASFTVDPENDSISVLKQYAEDRDINTSNWDFVYGPKESIYQLAMEGFLISVAEEPTAEGGILHTDAFILVDQEGHIRGVYDGTDRKANQQLINDIIRLSKPK